MWGSILSYRKRRVPQSRCSPERNGELAEVPMISIVDDDESVRESTKALVRSLGFAARTFASAEEFLQSDLDDTNCLILDIQMKGLSGVELQARLMAEGSQTQIIFIKGFVDERTQDHVLRYCAIVFYCTPIFVVTSIQ